MVFLKKIIKDGLYIVWWLNFYMKNLNIKKYGYKKPIQKLKMTIHIQTKLSYFFDTSTNLIGFVFEIFRLKEKHYINNFYGYTHQANYMSNNKLYKKYPTNVLKSNYKTWLKYNK